MKVIGGVFIGCFSFPIMFVGLQFLWNELLTHIGHPFYVVDVFLTAGVVWLVWGLVALVLGGLAAFRRKGSTPALALGIVLVVVAANAIPSIRFPADHARSAQDDARSTMLLIRMTHYAWAEESGRLPASQSELDDFARTPLEKDKRLMSRYGRDSQRLPYRLIYIADAPAPHLPVPPGAEPGIIYFAVSRDRKHFWLTATAMDQAVGGKVIFVPDIDKAGPWVVEGSLQQPPDPAKE